MGAGTSITLTPQDANAIIEDCPDVKSVSPVFYIRAQLTYGGNNYLPQTMMGVTPDYLNVRDWTNLVYGDSFTDQDVLSSAKVCLVGTTIVRELFNGENPVGKEMRLKNIPFKVIGVLAPKGANMMGQDQDDIVLAPWTTMKFRVSGQGSSMSNLSAGAVSTSGVNTLDGLFPALSTNSQLYYLQNSLQAFDSPMSVRLINVNSISAAAKSAAQIPAAMDEMTTLLRERHHLRDGYPDDFTIHSLTEFTDALSSTTVLMTKLLLFVAMISLIVGGVGIMNIMLVSVTERTREIGLRMAVGARTWDILWQFLVEAIVLCLMGGAIGITLGRGTSFLVSYFLRWPTEVSVGAIVAAIIVSASVGIIFGFYPAWKASKLDPIDALRYE
jgi:ABC-type antimicrobial peptide transport system permease subunit